MVPFSINQIVRGKRCGVFVVLGFRMVGDDRLAVLKELNPRNLEETAPGEVHLPVDCLKPYSE